jgi:hypothetical protein
MMTKLSGLIAVLLLAALAAPPQVAPVGAPAGSVIVKNDNHEKPVVLAQYTRCWNGRCR